MTPDCPIVLLNDYNMVKAIDLCDEQKNREKKKMKIYKKIYEKIEKKIIYASSMNMYECWYLISEFFLNIPLYNIEDCKQYLEIKLKADGFNVYFPNHNVIVISWN